MRKINSQFVTKFVSESGLDNKNATYYGFVELDKYYCMAVAEGYDDEGGSESAKTAVDAVIDAFVQKPGISAGRLEGCLKRAHRKMLEQSVRIRLKAGILLFVSDYTRCRYASCGNVILYLLRGAGIVHQSVTHTVYQSLLERQGGAYIRQEPAEETRNLYYYLGGNAGIKVSHKMKLQEDDEVLIATESFWNRVSRVEVLDAFESFQSAEEFLGDLQELYLRGSTDYIGSYCLAALNVKKIYQENTRLRKKIIIMALLLILLLALALALFYYSNRRQNALQQEARYSLSAYEEAGDRYLEELNSQLAIGQYEKAIETGKKLTDSEEQLNYEKELTDKISLGTNLEQAEQAYETMDFKKSGELYRQSLAQIKPYQELSGLKNTISQRLQLAQYGMEINTYIESASLKESQGALDEAEILYSRAESMLRIVNCPELLQQVQLSLLRVRDAGEQEKREEAADSRDEVILEADGQAALEAALAEDYETAIALYTQIRDGYIALEYNDKAKEISMLLALLQKQAQNAQKAEQSKELYADRLLLLQEEALQSVISHDYQEAIDKYDQMIQIYITEGNTEGAVQAEAAMQYLKIQQEGEPVDGQ